MKRTIANLPSVLAGLLCLFVALTSLRFLAAPVGEVMKHMAHYVPTVPVPLYLHILGGPLALALLPFQLSERLRHARPRLHRLTGYVYVTAVLAAGLGLLAMLPHFLGTPFAATGFALQAIGWIGFTLGGIWLAQNGNRAAHRRFMLRSAALGGAAVTLRLIMTPLIASGWSVIETYQITAWGAWLPQLLMVEWWIRSRPKHQSSAIASPASMA